MESHDICPSLVGTFWQISGPVLSHLQMMRGMLYIDWQKQFSQWANIPQFHDLSLQHVKLNHCSYNI